MTELMWPAALSPLNQALERGDWLAARALLAQGQVPDDRSRRLASLQDSLAFHLLIEEVGEAAPLLPGSGLGERRAAARAARRADELAMAWRPGDARSTARF